MIEERKQSVASGAEHDGLFTALLKGVDDEEDAAVLSTDDLMGNMYIFLLAGHGRSLLSCS